MTAPTPAAWAAAGACVAALCSDVPVGGLDIVGDGQVWLPASHHPDSGAVQCVRAAGILARRAAGGEPRPGDEHLPPDAWGGATSILVAHPDRLLDLACLSEELGVLTRNQLLNVWAKREENTS